MGDVSQVGASTATTSSLEQLYAFTIMERLTNNPAIPQLFQSGGLLSRQTVAHSGYTTSSFSVTPGYHNDSEFRADFISVATSGDYKISHDQAAWIFDNFEFDSFHNRTNNLFTAQTGPFGVKVDLAYRRINTPASYIDVVFSGTTAKGADLLRLQATAQGLDSAYYNTLAPDWLSSIATRAAASGFKVRPNIYSQGGKANEAIVQITGTHTHGTGVARISQAFA